jgi:hypothetical protein
MKISQIITEQYENQDPNRPADYIDDDGTRMWYDTNGKLHRDGDLPADVCRYGSQYWYQHGIRHRETGPAVIWSDGDVQFWLNNDEYSIDEWAEEVGMRRHEILVMKHKLGLH